MVGGKKAKRGGTRLARWPLAVLGAGCIGAGVWVAFALAASGPTIKTAENATYFKTGTVGLEGTTEDHAHPVNVAIHAGSAAGAVVKEAQAGAESGSWSTTVTLEDGQYTAVASQAEAASAAEVTFFVETEAPHVTLAPVSSPTKQSAPTLHGQADTAPGDEASVLVLIYKGSTAGGEVAASNSAPRSEGGRWEYTPEEQKDGTYTAEVTQKDGAGNVGSSERYTFVIDTKAPEVSLDAIKSPTNNRTPTLEGSAGTAEGDHHEVTVTIHEGGLGGPVVGSPHTTSAEGSRWSYTLSSPLGEGKYTAQATQDDWAGNIGHSEARTFTVKTAAPTLTLEAPGQGATLGTSEPQFSGAASNGSGDSETVTLNIYTGKSVAGSPKVVAVTRNGAKWSTTQALEDGTYTAQATQEDEAHNLGTSEAHTLTIKTSTPVVTLNGVPALSSNTTPEFSGTADLREGNGRQIALKIYTGEVAGGGALRTLHATANNSGEWSTGPVESLNDGTYTAQAEQEDNAGHTGRSKPVTFTVNAVPPKPTLNPLPKRTNDPTPTLEGTRGTEAHDEAAITLTLYEGGGVGGNVVGSPQTFGVAGSHWSYSLPHLSDGTYTAQAGQSNAAGKEGKSAAITFTVDTLAPHVTLDPVAPLSNNAKPTLTGAGGTEPGDGSQDTVTIYEGSSTPGPVAVSAKAELSGGRWSFTPAERLNDGTYTAQVAEVDEAGNPGASETRTFTINTASPKVTLNPPAPLSNITEPKLSGSASDTQPVTVRIYRGSAPSGELVWSASSPVSGGGWEAGPVTPALANGEYTAIATEPSSLGNPEGKSAPATFRINTSAPTVTLNQPTSPSNNTEPKFTGTASDTTPITIKVYEGTGLTGKPVGEATAAGTGGAWESTAVKLASGSHTYTAVATQKSSLGGNPEGSSVPVTFLIETNPPSITLNSPKTPSNIASPTFSGTATDTTGVTVNIFKGSKPTGPVFTTASATPSAGSWTSGPTALPLPGGTYTAQAAQPSSLGNQPGLSLPAKFVVDVKAPVPTITRLSHRSYRTLPELAGTAGTASGPNESRDLPAVQLKIYKGTLPGGEVALEAGLTASKGAWSLASSSSLVDGPYTAVATQSDEAGNVGASAPETFTIDTVAPSLTLTAPPEHTNVVEPPFTGSTSDPTPVTVTIYLLENGKSQPYATATGTPNGASWSSGKLTRALAQGRHSYAATATQTDEAGNTTTTAAVHFIVDTQAPTVTLDQPRSPTNDRTPSFSGTASGRGEVSVRVFAANGRLVSETKTAGTGHAWATAPLAAALPDGHYTAAASQETEKHVSESQAAPFIIDTVAPSVTLETVGGSGSSEQLRGTADTSDPDAAQAVSVQLFSGSSIAEGQAPVQAVEVSAPGGRWSTTLAGLSPGSYAVRAQQSDAAGNVGTSATGTFTLTAPAAAATAPPSPPTASFSWIPAAPHAGEQVSLVSNSTDPSSPITGFAWDLAGNGPFQAAGPVLSTSFATPGNHVVRLRVSDANGVASVATETIPVGGRAFVLMQPFPLVRLVTTRAGSGIRMSVLSILAPPGAHVTITCKGHGCPTRKQSKVATSHKVGLASVSFRRFERTLESGIVLEIRVSVLGQVGKYTRLSVAHSKLRRSDGCLSPNGVSPMACPS